MGAEKRRLIPVNLSRRYFLATSLLFSATQFNLVAQTAPKLASSIPIQADAGTQVSILSYWTPERRQAAVPRDTRLDPTTFNNFDMAPLSVNKAVVTGQGAQPTAGAVSPKAANQGAIPFEMMGLQNSLAEDYGSKNDSAVANPELIIGDTGFTFPYPFTRFNVLPDLYRQGGVLRKYPYTAVGKLFFTLNGTNYVCSASVARPHLLVTARHCVFNYVDPSGGQFATNVVFYPGWYSGPNASLGGGWVARRLATWVSSAPNYRYDIGFVQLFDNDLRGCNGSLGGSPIERYTGYLGYLYGGDFSKRQWNEFGYPQAAPFNGQVMVESQSATGALNVFGMPDTVEVGNDMTGGSSGGPWITSFYPGVSGATNYVNGVNSYKWVSPNHASAMNSPQFQDYNFNQLRLFAQGLSCP